MDQKMEFVTISEKMSITEKTPNFEPWVSTHRIS